MHFTQPQVSKILEDILQKEDGLNTILKLSLEALMKSERELYKSNVEDYSNGFRNRKAFGDKRMIELRVPRMRNGGFYPVILALLKNQEQEARSIAFELYRSGLTTEQVGNVFGEIYGSHYSSSQVSRMFDTAREEVGAWLNRPLEAILPHRDDRCLFHTHPARRQREQGGLLHVAGRSPRQEGGKCSGCTITPPRVAWLGNPSSMIYVIEAWNGLTCSFRMALTT
jgi:hypothetical protein